MQELVDVTRVEVTGDHRLRLWFEDGAEGEVDVSHWEWRGVFRPLADQQYFRRVSVDPASGTIAWPNGADVAPDTLHEWAVTGREPPHH